MRGKMSGGMTRKGFIRLFIFHPISLHLFISSSLHRIIPSSLQAREGVVLDEPP